MQSTHLLNLLSKSSLRLFDLQNGLALRSCGSNWRRDREVVLEAVRQNGGAITFAIDGLDKDPEVVEAAREQGEAAAAAAAAAAAVMAADSPENAV